MVSILLPTTAWTDGCEDVLAGASPDDELIVVADRGDDPVVADAPAAATVVVAGDPVACSGKANALAAGMERAEDRIVVWTDDDVSRDPGWRDRLVDHARSDGVATEVPVYVGGGLWQLLEPAMALFGSYGLVQGGHVWGGGVAFDREQIDETALVADLRRTLADDSLLSTYVDDPWVDRDHPRPVRVGGSPRAVYHRLARFATAAAYFEPRSTVGLVVVTTLLAVCCLLVPLVGLVATTAVGVACYRALGLSRGSVALTFPSLLVFPVALLVGYLAPTMEWGGRRYVWRSRFDVTVLEE